MTESGETDARRVEKILRAAALAHSSAAEQLPEAVAAVADLLSSTLESGGKVLLCGNGGSAADALHLAAELQGRLRRERRGLPAIALTVNPSVLTAVSNDYGYEMVFARQVEALGAPGDALVGISTSGTSPNVVRALELAHSAGLSTVGLTGSDPGGMEQYCDHVIRAPSEDTQRIQEIHIAVGHAICELVESRVAP
ncbi:MAG: SIS domain-containing protein [Candidatus Eisenbacteria bacterium]|nr:SIS domain-containing protein [Candidatus Eisenbacteria bacterium]